MKGGGCVLRLNSCLFVLIVIVVGSADGPSVKNADVDVGLTLWLMVRRIDGACICSDAGEIDTDTELGLCVVKRLNKDAGCF